MTQQIYTAQELGGNEGAIKSVAFYNNGTTQTRNVDIYIVSTEKASFSSKSDWIPVATNDKVFSGQVTLTKNAWTAITFDTSFAYDGTSNIAIMVFDHTGTSYYSSSRVKCLTFTAGNNYQSIYASRDNNVLDPLSPPTSGSYAPDYVKYKNQIKLDIEIDIQSCAKPKNFTANPTSLTHNSATLTWTEEEGQSLWEVYYTTSASDEPGDAPTSIYSTSTPNYHLTGLETNTEYYAYVRANCGGGDMSKWAKTTFKTTREAVVVDADTPYTQGFEEENDWEFINGTQSNQWCWGTATHNGDGSKAIYISNDGGTQNKYSNDATVAFAAKLFSFSQGYYSFRFNWKANGESKYDYLRVVLVPGDINYTPGTLPQDLNDNSTPTDWIALDNGAKLNLKSDWQQQVADVSVTGTYTMVFIWKNDTWTNNNPPAAIDNISITRTYPMPTSFSAYQVSPDYVVLTWQENSGASQWDLQYATDASFTNPVEVSGGTENDFQVNGNFVGYGLLGLNSGTKYFVRVRSVVGDHVSDWVEASFQTDCAELTLPYHCDFEGSLDETSFPMPLCWDRNSVTIQRETYPYVHAYASTDYNQYAHGEGTNSTSGHCLHFYKSSQTATETAILPAIASDYEMNQLQIRFWARLYTNTYAGKALDIGIMTSPSASGTFQKVGTITVGGDASNAHTNYEEFVVPFNEYTGEGRYIAIRAGSTMGQNVVQILVDDITIEAINSTFTKPITAYTSDKDRYYLIASPIGTVSPENVTNMLENSYDLYYFDQKGDNEGKEWINYRGDNGNFDLKPGKGYLYANNNAVTLTFTGTPYNGDGKVRLEKKDCSNASGNFEGWNLVGNPFAQTAYIGNRSFYVMNDDGTEITTSEANSIAPMEGIFVIANADGEELTFSTTRTARQRQQLVINVTQNRGNAIDRAIVRFDEESTLPKFQLNPNHTKVYIPQGGQDFAVVHSEGIGELPFNFKAEKNGTYTLSFSNEEVTFSYLHLIDNITGADVDLMQQSNYSFNARTSDNASRFRLVFAADGTSGDTCEPDFAYFNGSSWTISNMGEATLQVVDVMGRVLSSETISGNTEINFNQPTGIYMLRLVNSENVRVQKVVVR